MALVSTKEVERGLTHAGFQPLSVDLTPRATPGGGLTPTALAGMLEQRGWSRNAALGMAANAVHESGAGFGAPLNPGAVGDGGNSYGLFQWNGPRRIALQQFASSKGRDWKDVSTQLDFLDTEVGQDFQDLKGRLNTSKTAAEAARMFVTEFERPADLATNLRVRTATAQRLAGERPSFFGETAPAALRRETGVGSVIAAMDTTLYPVDPNFDPIGAAAEHEDLMPYLNDFVEVRNRDEFQRRMGQIRTRLADDDTLAAAGWQGIVASVGAGFLDPINLVPIGGGAWKALRAGRLAEGALTGLGGGLIGAGLQEGLLSASQPTRTAEESVLNVVSGGIGGTGLGVGAGLAGETASRASRAGYLAAGGAAGGAVAGGGVAAYSGQSLEDAAVSIGTGTVILGLLGGSVGAMARPGVSAKAAMGEAAARLDIETDAGNGAVYRDVREQLLAAGRPEAEADAGGSLWQAHIDAMAKATGQSQEKLYRALGLDVRTGALPEGALLQEGADLPMDEASRMARAEDQGFTTEAYHATGTDFEAFSLEPPSRTFESTVSKEGINFTSDNKVADSYAKLHADRGSEPQVMPVRLSLKNPYRIDIAESMPGASLRDLGDIVSYAKKKGYDSVIAKNFEHTVYDSEGSPRSVVGDNIVVFDPSQIRSRFAKFDPAQRGSANLLFQSRADVDWRPLEAVKEILGGLDKVSPEAESFGRFMKDQAALSLRGELGVRDLIKAYAITKSSIQRQAISRDVLLKAWPDFKGDGARVRPEDAFSEWLLSPAGKEYLDGAEQGRVAEGALDDLAGKFRPYGLSDSLVADLRSAVGFGQYVARAQELVTRSNIAPGEALDDWLKLASTINGIGGAKTGFMSSLLGAGDIPVFDARQIALHTEPGGKADLRAAAPKTRRVVKELAGRQDALGLKIPEGLEPYRQFLTHYTIWDALAGSSTTHAEVMRAMRFAQDARGAVEIGDSMARITLSARADASTFLHESGHVFLSHLDRLAKDTPGLAADAKVVREWLGVRDGPLTVAAQEKWARGFEAYLRDGKAPTPALQRAFDAFRDWLVSIYRSLADLDVELSDDVRAVMDRMLGVGEDVPDVEPGSLSAAVLQSAEGPDDLRIARGMEGVARVTSRIPGIAGPDMVLATSPTKAARRAMRKLVRPVVATVGDLAGRGASENVESNVGQWHGRLAVAVEQSKAVFVDYSFAARKAGEKWMHYSDFRDAVSSAGRRNDSGDKMPLGDEAKKAVSKVAAIYRREVFDPLLNEALRLGLMTQAQVDAARRFAESYIPRDWNIPKLVAERSRFTREVILPQVYADWEAAKVKLDSAAQISRFTDEQFREVEAAGRQHGGPEAAAFISEGPARSSTQMMRDNIKALEGAYNDPSVTWHEGDEARARDLIIKSKTPVIARDGMEGIRKGGPALDAAEAEELQNIVLRTLGMLPWDAGDSGARATRAVQAMKRWAETLKADGNAEESARVDALAKAHDAQTKKSLAQRAKAQRTLTAEDHLGRLDEEDLPGVASDIFDGLVGHETNRIQYEALKIQQRGPMKEKTFNVRDTKVEEWLENDIEVLAQKYIRTMAPDIELKRLTGDVNAETERQNIRLEYAEKAEGVPDGKEKTRLDKRQKADLEAFDGIVSRLRGTYGMPRNTAEVWGLRAGRLLKAYNFSRLMGSAVITQLSDIGRVMFMTKIGNLLGDAIVPLVSNWKAVKLSKAELKLADIATEIAKGNLAMRGAEIFDDYGHTTAAERFAQKSSAALATMFGLNHWNQGLKTVAGLVAQAKLARGVKALAAGETGLSWQMRSDLSRVGVNEREAVLLQKYIEAYGKPVHGVMIPNTKDWNGDDAADAARLWRSAMRQLVDDQVINPGQDRMLWMSRPLGSVLGQLETFNLVSTQRTLLVGLQRRDSAVVVGTAAMVGLGMLQFWIKAQLFGWAMPEDWDDWLGQGIKGSGLLAVLGSVENRLSAASRGAWSIDALTGSPSQSRYAAAGLGSLLGPTGSLAETGLRTTQAIAGGDWNWADTHRLRSTVPTQNFWIVRGAFTEAEKRFNDEFGIRNRQKQRKRN